MSEWVGPVVSVVSMALVLWRYAVSHGKFQAMMESSFAQFEKSQAERWTVQTRVNSKLEQATDEIRRSMQDLAEKHVRLETTISFLQIGGLRSPRED